MIYYLFIYLIMYCFIVLLFYCNKTIMAIYIYIYIPRTCPLVRTPIMFEDLNIQDMLADPKTQCCVPRHESWRFGPAVKNEHVADVRKTTNMFWVCATANMFGCLNQRDW